MVKKLFLLLSVISATSLSTAPAMAQSSDGGDDPEYIRNSLNLLPQHFFELDLFNTPSVSETDFTMRLTVPGSVAGCVKIVDPYLTEDQEKKYKAMVSGVEKKFLSSTLKVSVLRPELALDPEVIGLQGSTRFSPYDCDVKNSRAQIDIKLNKNELLKNKPEKIQLEVVSYDNETDFGEYKIKINKNRFIFEGVSQNGPVWFTQWFFPKNAVILYAPEAKIGQDVHGMIKDFGIAQGLTPMEDYLEDYVQPRDSLNFVIFSDPSGHIANQIKTLDDTARIGNIRPTRTRFTAKGETVESYELPVYAKKPGKE